MLYKLNQYLHFSPRFSLWQKYCDVSWALLRQNKNNNFFLKVFWKQQKRSVSIKIVEMEHVFNLGSVHTYWYNSMQTSVQKSLFSWSDRTKYLSARKIHHYQSENCAKYIETHIRAHCTFKVMPVKKKNKDTETLLILHIDYNRKFSFKIHAWF